MTDNIIDVAINGATGGKVVGAGGGGLCFCKYPLQNKKKLLIFLIKV